MIMRTMVVIIVMTIVVIMKGHSIEGIRQQLRVMLKLCEIKRSGSGNSPMVVVSLSKFKKILYPLV